MVRKYVALSVNSSAFGINLNRRLFFRLFGHYIDNPADGIGTVFSTGRPLNDFNVVYIFSPQPCHFITGPVIFGQVTHNPLPVYQDERMSRFGTANGNTHTPHSVNRSRNSRFLEDDIFNRLCLLFFNFFACYNRRLLAFILSFFFRSCSLYDNISSNNTTVSVCIYGHSQPCCNRQR